MMPNTLPRIEAANALKLTAFIEEYFPYLEPLPIPHHSGEIVTYAISLETPSTISAIDMDACFSLVALTSSNDYANSSIKWSPAKKRKEMRLPDLRYILIKQSPAALPGGFLSFMLTYEDGYEVIYCYEIHLAAHLRKLGLGARLIRMIEEVGRRVGVEKLMLTVFLANQDALAFYKRLGYAVDEFSPRPRILRGGITKEADYALLSRSLLDDTPLQDPAASSGSECRSKEGGNRRQGN